MGDEESGYVFDDGSTVVVTGGELVSITDSGGEAVPVPGPGGSSVVQQFTDLFNYGARAWLDSELRPSTAAGRTAGAPSTPLSLTRLLPWLLIGGAALVALKLAR